MRCHSIPFHFVSNVAAFSNVLFYRYLISGFGAYQSDTSLVITDIITALRWIKTNIISFGGNPSEVTLLGHSHGAALVNYLLLSKLGKGKRKKRSSFIIMLRFPYFTFIDHLAFNTHTHTMVLRHKIDIPSFCRRKKVNLIYECVLGRYLLFCFCDACVYIRRVLICFTYFTRLTPKH